MWVIIVCQAAEEGRLDAIRKAHQDGVNVNMTGTTKRGQRGTPLQYATMNGHRDILEFLVEVGVNPHIPSTGLCECWSVGTKSYALHTALAHSKVKGAAKLLIEGLGVYWSYPDMPALRDERPKDEDERPQPAGETLRYVLDYHVYNLEEGILARNDLDASVRDSLGRTPLFNAVSSGRLKTVKSLLQHPEADASVTGHYGLIPLHLAVDIRTLPIFEVLLRRLEVDATKKDDRERTLLHLAALRSGVDIAKLLHELPGVDAASPDGVERREVEAGISSVELVESGTYVTEGLEILNILLARPEVNAGLHDQKGLTPLHRACLLGDRKVAELLLQREGVGPNARGLNGQTPRHIAASCRLRGALELMDLLLEQPGVEITDCDYDGRTILHYIGGGLPQAWRAKPVIENALREEPIVSKRFKYNHSLLHLCTSAPNSPEDHRNEVVEELISRGIEIDTYTDSPLFDIDNDEDEKIDNVEGIRSASLVVGTDCTPLMWTVLGDQSTKNMEMLLDARADPNVHVVIRDLELEGKTKSNRQAFLSGVFRLAWDPEGILMDQWTVRYRRHVKQQKMVLRTSARGMLKK
ncbi:ankyrin repeat-containing domain protein [Fusarium venenatum]|uniref:ankyrin repeat-containing domain protein n=1 Tax=Fusarium venenatum TaxID=56646 RepID=UPI001D4A8D0D|nr:ankyrin repeat-containing domain protein [Fusarium venenatum]